jgi:hypothetical protein
MPVSVTAAFAVLLASAVAAGLSSLAARRQRMAEVAPWWGAFTVGLAYVIGHLGVATPSIPPGDVTDRIPVVALAGAIVAAILAGKRGVTWARVVGSIGLGMLASLLILGPVLKADEVTQLVTIAASLLAMTNVALLDAPSRRAELWVGLTVLTTGAGVVLILANSAVLFLLAGTLAAVLAAALLGAWGKPLGGGIPVASAVLTALVIEGAVYASLSAKPALILAASSALLWLIRLGPLGSLGPKARCALASVLVLIPVAIAIGLILTSASAES